MRNLRMGLYPDCPLYIQFLFTFFLSLHNIRYVIRKAVVADFGGFLACQLIYSYADHCYAIGMEVKILGDGALWGSIETSEVAIDKAIGFQEGLDWGEPNRFSIFLLLFDELGLWLFLHNQMVNQVLHRCRIQQGNIYYFIGICKIVNYSSNSLVSVTFLQNLITFSTKIKTKMFGPTQSLDKTIKQYVDKIFATYDKNRSGTLQARQLQQFLNDLFVCMGSPQRVSKQDAQRAISSVDLNGDGHLDKSELALAFKHLYQQQDPRFRQMGMMQHQFQPNHAPTRPHRDAPQQYPGQPVQNKNMSYENSQHHQIYDIPEPYHGSVHHRNHQEAQNVHKKMAPSGF